jgi:hypothetical protein
MNRIYLEVNLDLKKMTMKKHKKFNLLEIIENSIKECGWTSTHLSEKSIHPFRIKVSNGKESYDLRIYIWNLSHGGGTKRPKHEYRIQITGVNRFEKEKGEKSLILGWMDELQVFAGFDFRKHTSKLGFSPSMQIIEETLTKARFEGLSVYEKTNGEIAVAFRPDFFMEYVKQLDQIHSLDKEEEIIDESESEITDYRYSITSYGADFLVDGVVQRISDDVIFVPPFQRNFVWDINRASKFIESLILGLPVPGIFLSKESSTQKLLIIDGQQRLLSLYAFITGTFKNKVFKLQGVQKDLEGKTFNDLNQSDKIRLKDSIIHATIIKQDEPDDNESSIFLIYERLNTGGKLLNAQEIRASIYYGDFNEYLNELVKYSGWRNIFGKPNDRMKEQELLLRFFALYYGYKSYQKPLKTFLNSFMAKNRDLKKYSTEKLGNVFTTTIDFINDTLGNKAFRMSRGINVAVFDSIMIGVALRLSKGPIKNSKKFISEYHKLLDDNEFSSLTRSSTTDDASIKGRINMSIEKFDSLI